MWYMDKEARNLYKSVGSLIEKARRSEDGKTVMTQADLAGQIGLSRTSIVNIVRGRQRIAIDMLYKIAYSLGVSPADLLPKITLKQERIIPEDIKANLSEFELGDREKVTKIIMKEVDLIESKRNKSNRRKTIGRGRSKDTSSSNKKSDYMSRGEA